MPNEEERKIGAIHASQVGEKTASIDRADEAESAIANILGALRSFADKIGETILAGRREGVLRATEEVYTRHPIQNGAIKTTDFGVELVSFLTEEFTKESWFHATRTVVWRLQASEEYAALLRMLDETRIGTERANRLLDSFAHRIAYRFLELDDVFLRRVATQDLVEECSAFMDRHRDIWRARPTAILRLGKVVEWENEVQKVVWQAITILRLFKVGSVRELSYTNESESFFGMGGTHTSHQHYSSVTRSVIAEEDTDRFIAFWQRMSELLPAEGYGRDQKRVDPIEIAYQRYSDALLSWGGTVERRISDAVIGLESLLLSENEELSFRLRLRAAKLLNCLGNDPYGVRDVIKQAYSVRSAFLHGDHVKKETRKRIERDHVNLDDLLLRVLEYLRSAIVIVILGNMTKNELISRLDNSFVDDHASQQLEGIITNATSNLIGFENA